MNYLSQMLKSVTFEAARVQLLGLLYQALATPTATRVDSSITASTALEAKSDAAESSVSREAVHLFAGMQFCDRSTKRAVCQHYDSLVREALAILKPSKGAVCLLFSLSEFCSELIRSVPRSGAEHARASQLLALSDLYALPYSPYLLSPSTQRALVQVLLDTLTVRRVLHSIEREIEHNQATLHARQTEAQRQFDAVLDRQHALKMQVDESIDLLEYDAKRAAAAQAQAGAAAQAPAKDQDEKKADSKRTLPKKEPWQRSRDDKKAAAASAAGSKAGASVPSVAPEESAVPCKERPLSLA
jgi:hypothetical protein